MKAIILCGGSGTRLWPMSRKTYPKQFLPLLGQTSLLYQTYERLLGLLQKEDIFISTSPELVRLVQNELPNIKQDQLIIEPERRDTGPAMGYAALYLAKSYPDEPCVFIPSDHAIRQVDQFLACLALAGSLVEETGKLLDIGVHPTFPNTMLGYTRLNGWFDTRDNIEIFRFAAHVEKPNEKTAIQYLQAGNYLWHASYYTWTPRKFLQAINYYHPVIGQGFKEIELEFKQGHKDHIQKIYATFPKISFDYLITEKLASDDVLILRGDFGWSDIGSWKTLYDYLVSETGENIMQGCVVSKNSESSFVIGSEKKLIALFGVKDLVVIDTKDALLITSREKSSELKELLQHLENSKQNQFL